MRHLAGSFEALALRATDLREHDGIGTHYHTQHPLELTNLLNGYDGSGQTDCRQCWAKGLKAWQDGRTLMRKEGNPRSWKVGKCRITWTG